MATLREKQKASTQFIVSCMFDWWDCNHGDGFAAWVDGGDLAARLEKIYGAGCREETGALPSAAQYRVIERACSADRKLRDELTESGEDDGVILERRQESLRRRLALYIQ